VYAEFPASGERHDRPEDARVMEKIKRLHDHRQAEKPD
jgi:hypothetical protein